MCLGYRATPRVLVNFVFVSAIYVTVYFIRDMCKSTYRPNDGKLIRNIFAYDKKVLICLCYDTG